MQKISIKHKLTPETMEKFKYIEGKTLMFVQFIEGRVYDDDFQYEYVIYVPDAKSHKVGVVSFDFPPNYNITQKDIEKCKNMVKKFIDDKAFTFEGKWRTINGKKVKVIRQVLDTQTATERINDNIDEFEMFGYVKQSPLKARKSLPSKKPVNPFDAGFRSMI